jgi:hypothetical protein
MAKDVPGYASEHTDETAHTPAAESDDFRPRFLRRLEYLVRRISVSGQHRNFWGRCVRNGLNQ